MTPSEKGADGEKERPRRRLGRRACRWRVRGLRVGGGPKSESIDSRIANRDAIWGQPIQTSELRRREFGNGEDPRCATCREPCQGTAAPSLLETELLGKPLEGKIMESDDGWSPGQQRNGVGGSEQHVDWAFPQQSRQSKLLPADYAFVRFAGQDLCIAT